MGSPQPGTEACRSCGAGNPEGARFCGSCGASLAAMQALSPVRRRESRRPAVLQLLRRETQLWGRHPTRAPWARPRPARRRAQAGDGAVRRRQGLDGHGRAGRSRGVAPDHAALLLAALRGRPPLRGHGGQVHRRRDHGPVRGADRARGPRAAGLLRGAPHRRAGLRVRGRAAPRQGDQLLGPDRDQLGRGGRRGDRRGQRAWSTRPSATRSASPSGWRPWPSPARPTSPSTPPSSPRAIWS